MYYYLLCIIAESRDALILDARYKWSVTCICSQRPGEGLDEDEWWQGFTARAKDASIDGANTQPRKHKNTVYSR